MKLDILVFASHPDDAELGAGGTIAKEVSRGKKVGIVDLTRGELGTRGSMEIRARESARAAEILGLSARENMGFADGCFTNDKAHQMELIRVIRKYRPEIVRGDAVQGRHVDDGWGSKLVSDACYLSGLTKITTQGEEGPRLAWRRNLVCHYIQWLNLVPDFVVDITGFIDTKNEAILAYGSQFYDPKSEEPETPISSKNFTDSVVYRARDLGRIVGVEYAEGFTVERHLAVDSLFDLV